MGADVTGEGETRPMGLADDGVTAEAELAVGCGEAALLTGDGGDEQLTVELLYW